MKAEDSVQPSELKWLDTDKVWFGSAMPKQFWMENADILKTEKVTIKSK